MVNRIALAVQLLDLNLYTFIATIRITKHVLLFFAISGVPQGSHMGPCFIARNTVMRSQYLLS